MEHLTKNQYSHFTAKERDTLSFPAKLIRNKKLLLGEILDFGCGFGKDVEVLKQEGFHIVGYDKFYFPDFPQKKFDTIICFYVLNVLLPEEQNRVLMEVSQLLKPTGRAYFAVRRDIRFEGYRTHKIHQKQTYQCNVVLDAPSIFKNENCEIYEYRPIHLRLRFGATNCVFCSPVSVMHFIAESKNVYAIFDKFPVTNGHALIIPKSHGSDYFDLSTELQQECWQMVNYVKETLDKTLAPNGYNIGINIGKAAGQTVHHVHLHLIPRFTDDMEDPRGGVRGVIPEKQKY